MDAIANVFTSEVLILNGYESGDCQDLDDRHLNRSRGGSELIQSDDVFPSESSRFSFELQCFQDEDVQVRGWCHEQDDVCQLAKLRPSSFFLIFYFLAFSSLAFHFSDVLERWFLNGSSRMIMLTRKCHDRSVGRNHRSLFWRSKTLLVLANVIILRCHHWIWCVSCETPLG